MLYFLKHKSDTLLSATKYIANIAPYGNVKCLRTDNGTEFTSEPFQRLLILNRIKHEQSAPYSPHQNGTAEQSYRTLFSMARCLLHHHHVAPPARTSLTVSRHFSLSFIASGRSSGLQPVSSHSCCM